MRVPAELIEEIDFEATVVAELSARNRYLPPPLADRALLPRVDALADRLRTQLRREFDPSRQESVLARKSGRGSRPLPYMALEDRLVYRALVGALEARLSYVPRRGDHESFVRSPLEVEGCTHVLKADVAAFYQYVDHEQLIDEVVAQTGDDLAVTAVVELLQGGTGRRFGLPQMHASSDVLGDLYVDPIRRDLVRQGHSAFRFADDFRVACSSYSEALATLELIERAAYGLGLVLNESKTGTPRRSTYEESLGEVARAEGELFRQLAVDGMTIESFFSQVLEEYVDEDDDVFDEVEIGTVSPALPGVGDDEVEPPDTDELEMPSDEQLEVAVRVVSDWGAEDRGEHDWSQGVWSALLRKSLHTLTVSADERGVGSAISMLVREPHLTPQVCNYLVAVGQDDVARVHGVLDELAGRDVISGWQSVWVAYLAGSVGTTPSSSADHVAWLRRQLNSPQQAVAAQAALALARRRLLSVEEGAGAYERASRPQRPTVALALAASHGIARTEFPAGDQVEGWLAEWSSAQRWGRRPAKKIVKKAVKKTPRKASRRSEEHRER